MNYIDVDSVSASEAFRRQADAINYAAPIYNQLEYIDNRLERIQRVEKELRIKILAQNMPLPSSSTRTNELVDAFILNKAVFFKLHDGEIKDVTYILLKHFKKKNISGA